MAAVVVDGAAVVVDDAVVVAADAADAAGLSTWRAARATSELKGGTGRYG